jgi:hypothetical protein
MGGDAMSACPILTGHWRDFEVNDVDLLCVDAPYSEKTHKGHDDGAATSHRAQSWASKVREEKRPPKRRNAAAERAWAERGNARKAINYAFWTPADVDQFVDFWAPRTRGWFVSLTDDQLAPAWAAALTRHKRLTFSPIACVEPGSRVRMVGDGPSQWSCWLVVARPKRAPFSKWGALPGAYVVPPGLNPRPMNGGKQVVGGKPLWLMERLVEDYSRPGDLVVDPCCGAGTSLVAALRHGRRAMGVDVLPEHAELAREAIAAELELSTVRARRAGQVPLFAAEAAE